MSWRLHETANSFLLVPTTSMCVQTSLTIDKATLKATEHGICEPNNPISTRKIYGLLGILNIF